ncbi:MCE family protein [Flammeovirga yaeyamensis]|uniref:MCE family protein n=1 Tax=Flammeovirga yaeyamensis TaxID=367791 RepID=A0AAX1N7Y3_9BACT|nr:MlaD family protein [Flammeovirga yaeyamensis]MBB3699041.1 phospholipid/cholesterol/gamma-HCH transport system substrate-binding protein [Flammeovirga yaeyamensis]NMF36475.1 MCE family protein [Flammeovirga yaeyamensis]QWG03567.1 MCE family protein [Flammeovirga yaeyamensis]
MAKIKIEFSNEVKVALFATICFIVLWVGYNFLKGIDVFSNQNQYFVVYDQTPDLQVSNIVTINGVKVGRVSFMELLQEENNKVKVTLDINKDYTIYKGAIAVIADKGMLGDKQVIIRFPVKKALAEEGSILEGEIEDGMIAAISKKADPILASLESTLDTARFVMSTFKTTSQKVDDLLITANYKMANIDTRSLNVSIQNFEKISNDFADASSNLEPMLASFKNIADSLENADLKKTVEEAQLLLANMNKTLDNVNNPEGSVGALLTQRELHDQMVKTMADLDSLFIDFQAHPKRYVHFSVFGKKDKAPKEEKKK